MLNLTAITRALGSSSSSLMVERFSNLQTRTRVILKL